LNFCLGVAAVQGASAHLGCLRVPLEALIQGWSGARNSDERTTPSYRKPSARGNKGPPIRVTTIRRGGVQG
jgi:hypothetical protein